MPMISTAQINAIQSKVGGLIDGFSQDKVLIVCPGVSSISCPACGYDWISKTGKNPDCETCHGTGKVTQESTIQISALVSNIKETRIGFGGLPAGVTTASLEITISWQQIYEHSLTHDMITKSKYIIELPIRSGDNGEVVESRKYTWIPVEPITTDMIFDRIMAMRFFVNMEK